MNHHICVIGAGRWGRNHIRTLHDLGCLGGIAEQDPAALDDLRKTYPETAMYRDFREAAKAGFDGFVIATTADTHHAIGRYLLDRGRHVLVEKPMALTAADARDLAAASERTGAVLMVGHVLLFHPAVRAIKRLIAGGRIGRLQYLYSNRLNLGTVRTEENILWSFAPHDISVFQFLIGRPPTAVISRGGAFLQPHIHDTTMTVLTYPENVVGHIFVSWLHPFKEHRLVAIGSDGMLMFEDAGPDRGLRFYSKGIEWVRGEPVARSGPTESIPYDAAMPLTEELRYFISRLDGAPVEYADAASGIEVLDILERATASLMGG